MLERILGLDVKETMGTQATCLPLFDLDKLQVPNKQRYRRTPERWTRTFWHLSSSSLQQMTGPLQSLRKLKNGPKLVRLTSMQLGQAPHDCTPQCYGGLSIQWFERMLDDSTNEYITLPDAFLTTDIVVSTLKSTTEDLVVCIKLIARCAFNGLLFMETENIIVAIVKKEGDRQEPYERIWVQMKHAFPPT